MLRVDSNSRLHQAVPNMFPVPYAVLHESTEVAKTADGVRGVAAKGES